MSSITAILHKNLQGYFPPDISSVRGEQCPRAKAVRTEGERMSREGGGIIHIFPETKDCVCYPFTGADK